MNARTHIILILVALAISPLSGIIQATADAASVLSIHPENHRVFLYRGKPMKILTSAEHYGSVVNGDFDYDVYLLYFVDEQVYLLKPCEERKLEISLSLTPGRYSVETLNPGDGKRSSLPAVSSNGEPTIVSLHFHEDVAVLLNRTKQQ